MGDTNFIIKQKIVLDSKNNYAYKLLAYTKMNIGSDLSVKCQKSTRKVMMHAFSPLCICYVNVMMWVMYEDINTIVTKLHICQLHMENEIVHTT